MWHGVLNAVDTFPNSSHNIRFYVRTVESLAQLESKTPANEGRSQQLMFRVAAW
jgi:hypothetical protein